MSRRQFPEGLEPDTWASHPAWSTQAYPALVGFHDRYRRETARLVAAAMDDAESIGELRDACVQLSEHLHNHEAVEEQGLYPWIEGRYGLDLSAQVSQHARLNEVLVSVLEHLEGDGGRAELRQRLVVLDDCLQTHLTAEERICVPALLAATADEFAALVG